jgi:hypothetical protein
MPGSEIVKMEGIQTEASPSAGYVVVPRPGTVFIEARIITQNELDIQEVSILSSINPLFPSNNVSKDPGGLTGSTLIPRQC